MLCEIARRHGVVIRYEDALGLFVNEAFTRSSRVAIRSVMGTVLDIGLDDCDHYCDFLVHCQEPSEHNGKLDISADITDLQHQLTMLGHLVSP